MKDINKYRFRYKLFSLLDKGLYSAMDIAWELNLSIRQVRRLKAIFKSNKDKVSVFIPKAKSAPWNKVAQNIINENPP